MSKKVGDAGILGSVDELHVSLFVIFFASLSILLLGCSMEGEYSPVQSHDSLLSNAISGEEFLAVVAYGIELLNVLVFSPSFTLKSLFLFELFRHAGVMDGRFANTMEVEAIERQHSTVSEATEVRRMVAGMASN